MLEIIFQETYHLNLFAMCQHYFHCVSVNLMVKIFETPKYLWFYYNIINKTKSIVITLENNIIL